MSTNRKTRGNTLALVSAVAFVFVLIGLAIYGLTMILGGSKETSNAVDAGALNVSKQALTITVDPTTSDEQQFSDVADSNGKFGLKNIDYVWGKALLAAINATAMQNENVAGQGTTDAQALQTAAQDISTRLSQQLNQPDNLYGFFTDVAQSNSVRMLGKKSYVAVFGDNAWKTSLMERGDESNVSINTNELPANFDASVLSLTPPAKDGNVYLAGYKPMQLIGQTFCFVPFAYGEKPHLVGGNDFQANMLTQSPLSWTNPVPNALSVHGATTQGTSKEQSFSWAITNPQLYFKMRMPQAFIRIKIQANTLQWNVDGIPADSSSYGFLPGETQTSIVYPLPCGTLSGTEWVGNEYLTGPTLFTALFAQPPIPPMPSQTWNYLLQRCQEILPGYSGGSLTGLLTSTPIDTSAGDQEFIIYPSSNQNNATLLCVPASGAPSWANTQPDGQDETLETEGPLGPNQGMTELGCYGTWDYPSYTTFSGERHWTAGTGYGGCLGTVTIHRTTTAYLFGLCSCP